MRRTLALLLSVVLLLAFLTSCSGDALSKISMPFNSTEYIGTDWTIDKITEHFKELGFTNINEVPCETSSERYDRNIFKVEIQETMFNTTTWEAGDSFQFDAEISIYYNKDPLLTVDNCLDLIAILSSKDMDYMEFCNKYDGHYVKFDGHIIGHIRPEHLLFVAGGDYDGHTDLKYYSPSTYAGLEIKIGDNSMESSIDISVDLGDHVTVIGRVDADLAKFHKCVYVETLSLSRR